MKLESGRSTVRRRYDRVAPFYDLFESPMEPLAMKDWRRRVLQRITGSVILEAGAGTGKNFPLYAPGQSVDNPVHGLSELGRVVKSSGRIFLLEHMRPGNRALGALFGPIELSRLLKNTLSRGRGLG